MSHPLVLAPESIEAIAQRVAELLRTNEDKRRAVEIALKEFPKLSKREIAKICAVNDTTVSDHMKRCGIPAPEQVTGADGKSYPAHKPARPATIAVERCEAPRVRILWWTPIT